MPLSAFQNVFSGNPLDRASDRRGDPDWIAERLAAEDTLCVVMWQGRPLIEDRHDGGVRIAYIGGRMAQDLAAGDERLLFLGLTDEGGAVFALDLEGLADPAAGPLDGLGRFSELRPIALQLAAPEAGVLATAKQMFEWRRRHRHCANCGQPSVVADAGWKRRCPACEAEHFPRTDPVVIMVPTHGDRCMLGRQERWPPGMFSALAGFLEPGETIEEACARELAEEAGLRTLSVRYHSTQPWPFPASLMIGLIAQVEDDEGTPDQTELSEIRWFTREEARDLLAGRIEGVFAPNPAAIAHQILKAWVEGF